jgi:hypothetical protein
MLVQALPTAVLASTLEHAFHAEHDGTSGHVGAPHGRLESAFLSFHDKSDHEHRDGEDALHQFLHHAPTLDIAAAHKVYVNWPKLSVGGLAPGRQHWNRGLAHSPPFRPPLA